MGLDDTPEYQAAQKIWKVVPPILLALGTVGNLLSIIVLLKKTTRKSSTAVYLTTLACTDLLVLWTGLLRQWIKYLFKIDVRHLSQFGCKLHVFLVYAGTQMASWILVAVTTERFIGVWCPHKVKMGCTPATACTVVTIICILISCLNAHWFFGVGELELTFGNVTQTYKCVTLFDSYGEFLHFIWPWVDMCVFGLIPFVILVFANSAIVIKVVLSHKKSRSIVAPARRGSKQNKSNSKSSQLTAMLLTINTVFLLCVTPISIYLIGEPIWIKSVKTIEEYAIFTLWWAIVNSFMYTNHTVNFMLYFLSGSRFRQEVKALFCGGKTRSLFGVTENPTRVAPSNTEATQIDQCTSMQAIQSQLSGRNDKSREQVIESVA